MKSLARGLVWRYQRIVCSLSSLRFANRKATNILKLSRTGEESQKNECEGNKDKNRPALSGAHGDV